MNEIREIIVEDYLEVPFEKYLHSKGFVFSKQLKRWFHNDKCIVYHYSCDVWVSIDTLHWLNEQKK
ncbi:hypothetical protein [Flavobacterium algoritolerans]|uniref:Uncharacterized protein n=1 Tax=Flavobacterium algoritolerans TaxID=3041254 RepID=A0ABT6VC87_9FLAO|nr:hypothetical protein [Flavobacterium algoritolerans]MDI5895825.1 hypothetical protein [Flavobacterium algoritolerans]